ncbi:unnamed protein product [Gadus morhua 'NCC']
MWYWVGHGGIQHGDTTPGASGAPPEPWADPTSDFKHIGPSEDSPGAHVPVPPPPGPVVRPSVALWERAT